MNTENYILIMVDECGDETEINRFCIPTGLDEDAMELWKEKKFTEARTRFPEAQYFYFEDRRGWDMLIAGMLHRGI